MGIVFGLDLKGMHLEFLRRKRREEPGGRIYKIKEDQEDFPGGLVVKD